MAKVLVVDDDATFRDTVQELLTEEGYEPCIAENGADAVQAFNNMQPDVVLLDMLMPKMSGFDCAATLRSTPLGRQIPIIFVSGAYKNPKTITEAQERFQCSDYLVKPFNADDLFAALRVALGSADVAAEVQVPATPLPEEGSLIETSVAHLLLRIHREKHNGILDIFGESNRARLFFFRGNAAQAQISRPDLNVGMALVKLGHLSPYDYKALLEHVEENAVGLYQALRDFKTVPDTAIKEGYRATIPQIVAASVALKGQFRWLNSDQFMRLIPTTNSPIMPALYQGIREAPQELLLAHLEPYKRLRMNKGTMWQEGKRHLTEGIGLDDVLRSVNGRARIAQVYGSAGDDQTKQQRMAQLFLLLASGAVELTQEIVEVEPSMVEAEPSPLEIGAQPDAGSAIDEKIRQFAAGSAEAPSASDAFDYDAEADLAMDSALQFTEEEVAARDLITAKFKEIRELDFYQVFGTEMGKFDISSIKKAYFQLAREFHSDSYSGMNLGSATKKLESVFSKISEAYDTLSTDAKRMEYDAHLEMAAKGLSADVATIFQAESLLDKGIILADRGDFTAAMRSMEEAMGLYPQPAIEVWYAYCNFRARGNQESEGHLAAKRIQDLLKSARVERGYEFLGMIYRLIGDYPKAKKWFHKANYEDGRTPNVDRELRLIAKRMADGEKKGGFKLFK